MNVECALEVGGTRGGEGVEGGGTTHIQVVGCCEGSVVNGNSSCTLKSSIAVGEDHLIACTGKVGNGDLAVGFTDGNLIVACGCSAITEGNGVVVTGIGLITEGDGIVGVGHSLEAHHDGAVACSARIFANGNRGRASGIGGDTNGHTVLTRGFCISTDSNGSVGGIGISTNGSGLKADGRAVGT